MDRRSFLASATAIPAATLAVSISAPESAVHHQFRDWKLKHQAWINAMKVGEAKFHLAKRAGLDAFDMDCQFEEAVLIPLLDIKTQAETRLALTPSESMEDLACKIIAGFQLDEAKGNPVITGLLTDAKRIMASGQLTFEQEIV